MESREFVEPGLKEFKAAKFQKDLIKEMNKL